MDVVSIFPSMIEGYCEGSLLKKAQDEGYLNLRCHDLRNWSIDNNHKSIDDTPFGGGAGMVMRPEPFFSAVDYIKEKHWQKENPEVVSSAFNPGPWVSNTIRGRRVAPLHLALFPAPMRIARCYHWTRHISFPRSTGACPLGPPPSATRGGTHHDNTFMGARGNIPMRNPGRAAGGDHSGTPQARAMRRYDTRSKVRTKLSLGNAVCSVLWTW